MTREEREQLVKNAYDRFYSSDRRQRHADYKKLLSTPEGRRFIMWIKTMAKLESPLRGHELNEHQLAYAAGMHDIVALMFKSLRTHEPELVFKAEMERAALKAERRAEVNQILQSKIDDEE